MEQNLGRLRLLWNFLRIISTGLVAATSLLILLAIPNGWLIPLVPLSGLCIVAAIIAVTQWRIAWIWLALLVLASLFVSGLLAAVFGLIGEEYVPVLLLSFTMILMSEHTLTTISSYSAQFANRGNLAIREFNVEALRNSLNHLYKRIARDSLVLVMGFVLSAAAVSVGAFGPAASILSDPSLYMVIASISLAALVMLKED
jgi:hypothetical protein